MSIHSVLVKNKMGLEYRIVQDNTEPFSTIICETLQKSILVVASVGQLNRGWYAWMHDGKLAQDAFPFLAHEQREFLISGITPVEWHELFDHDDEKCNCKPCDYCGGIELSDSCSADKHNAIDRGHKQ